MLRFHHVNLGIPVGGADAEMRFLVDLLGYRRVQPSPGVPATARWFEGEDGAQVHLSEDPEHRAPARAHVAVVIGDELPALERRLDDGGHHYDVANIQDRRVVLCRDPAGNLWELRGSSPE